MKFSSFLWGNIPFLLFARSFARAESAVRAAGKSSGQSAAVAAEADDALCVCLFVYYTSAEVLRFGFFFVFSKRQRATTAALEEVKSRAPRAKLHCTPRRRGPDPGNGYDAKGGPARFRFALSFSSCFSCVLLTREKKESRQQTVAGRTFGFGWAVGHSDGISFT